MPTMKVPKLYTRAEIQPSTYNPEKRTVDLVFTTGYKGIRTDWWTGERWYEELEVSDTAMRMERLNSGRSPFLNCHNGYAMQGVIGVIERAWLENGEGHCTIRFSGREDVADIVRDVADGILGNVSVGYQVHRFEKIESADEKIPTYRAVDWEPLEVSLVPIGFDPDAKVRAREAPEFFEAEIITRSAPPAVPGGQENKEENHMTTPALRNGETTPAVPPVTSILGTETRTEQAQAQPTKTEAQIRAEAEASVIKRAATIRNQVRIAQLGEAFADDLISRNLSVEEASEEITRAWSEKGSKAPTNAGGATIGRNETDTRRRAMEAALILRIDSRAKLKPEEVEMARQYRGMSMIEMARESTEAGGISTRGMSRLEIAGHALSQRMHTTSDFALVLSSLTNKRLRTDYEETEVTYDTWARKAPNAPDFKNINVLQTGAAPNLELIAEGAEYKQGTIAEGGTTYKVFTYGKMIVFSRQMLINDDLRAFGDITSKFASSGRRLENHLVYQQILSNPTMSDGTALFDAAHGNLVGAGAISVTTLGAGRAAMRKQTGLGGEKLNIRPSYLIVPSDIEQVAYQYTSAQFVPSQASNINEFRAGGRTALQPIVEAELDDSSTSVWYLAADNRLVDTVEFCFLEGSEGIFMDSEIGFDVDGMKMKARLDFATKVIDYRGLYRNGTP